MLIHYQKFGDRTLDSLLDAVPRRTMLRSPKFMFFAFFGYWLKRKGDMTMIFRKPAR